jgi:DNA-directed RNA polymerase specialized sigma24 family protein
MNLPSGITENDFLQVMGAITNSVKDSYSFGYYDSADISQECYIFAIEALPKYNCERGSLFTFLNTHIKNRLLNLRRNKLIRVQLPCLDCHICVTEEERNKCKKYLKWKRRNELKKNLMESFELTDTNIDNKDQDSLSLLLNTELMCIIDRNLPINLRSDYRRILEGSKISKKRKMAVVNIIINILRNNQYGGE